MPSDLISDQRAQRAGLWLSALGFLAALMAALPAIAADEGLPEALKRDTLRVCADPNNMPFSNQQGEGFENKLAELVARDLGKTLAYTWHAQRRGFIRNTLAAGECDVVMGTSHSELLSTTRSYYRSTYVFVSRADQDLNFSSIKAPELKTLRIGVHLIGDDGANTPPAHALGEQGIVDNVHGYLIYGDYRQASPPARLIDAVATGRIDIAAVWGPLAGYHAEKSEVPLRIVPITDTLDYMPLMFEYPIAMGVRKTDPYLKSLLNEVIYQRKDEIEALLAEYRVPRPGADEVIVGGNP